MATSSPRNYGPGSPASCTSPGVGARPGLATLLVGDDYASMAYDRRLRRLADRLDCPFTSERLPADVELADVQATIGKLNADPRITGILILRPMPRHVPEVELYRMLDPAKDIEAVHPANAGLLAQGRPRFIPSTPASCFYLLDAHVKSMGQNPKTWYDGRTVVLVGRSHNVGKPALWLGLERNATVVSAHKATADAGKLGDFCRQADVLIVAAGVPGVVTGEMVSEGVIAVDVGINAVLNPETGKNKMVGDIDFATVAARVGDHPSARWRRSDHRRVAAAQHHRRCDPRPHQPPDGALGRPVRPPGLIASRAAASRYRNPLG